jgi:hypothetical protein
MFSTVVFVVEVVWRCMRCSVCVCLCDDLHQPLRTRCVRTCVFVRALAVVEYSSVVDCSALGRSVSHGAHRSVVLTALLFIK